jgi:glycosyltransferase involved in cell wall biosynthesis
LKRQQNYRKVKNLSIIICAFNEEKTVCEVIQACREFNPESEILLIDDGSTDATPYVLQRLSKRVPFTYLRLEENMGKSYAMCQGIIHSSNEILMFFDADSYGIREEHFRDMIKPITEGTADMVLGHTSANFMNYKLKPFKSFTGERVLLRKDIMPLLDDIRELRFGIETYMNYYYQTNGKKIKYVHLEGLHTLTKFEKRTLSEAAKDYLKEGNEIATTILRNYFPIARMTKDTISSTGETLKVRFSTLQDNISKRVQFLKERRSL